jgi:hypothetical protein
VNVYNESINENGNRAEKLEGKLKMEKKNSHQEVQKSLDRAIISSDLLIRYQNWAIERIENGLKVSWKDFCNSPAK